MSANAARKRQQREDEEIGERFGRVKHCYACGRFICRRVETADGRKLFLHSKCRCNACIAANRLPGEKRFCHTCGVEFHINPNDDHGKLARTCERCRRERKPVHFVARRNYLLSNGVSAMILGSRTTAVGEIVYRGIVRCHGRVQETRWDEFGRCLDGDYHLSPETVAV